MPAVMLVLALCMVSLQLGSQQLQLHDAAAVSARALARGDTAPLYEGAVRSVTQQGDLVCATLTLAGRPPLFVTLSAQSCALR